MTSRTKAKENTRQSVTDSDILKLRTSGELCSIGKEYRSIDLFAGAGGLSLGFSEKLNHIFKPVWANDFNSYAAETFNYNFGEVCSHGDIVSILKSGFKVPEADVVMGGPPCQGFSLLNKNRTNDPRKQLWRPYLDVVEQSGAQIFVMENVPQLLQSEEFLEIEARAKELGFHPLATAKLCAADYGAPQVRWRAFIIGCKFEDPRRFFPPMKTHQKPGWKSKDLIDALGYVENPKPWVTVRDVIEDLPRPEGVEIRKAEAPLDLHFGRTPTAVSLARYKAIPKEGMNRFDLQRRARKLTPQCWIRKTSGGTDLFGRLWWDRPSVTIRTEFFKPEKGRYLHPKQHRPITHREAARIQTFPDTFHFLGSKIEIAKQIGNAVPPALASRVADYVAVLLFRRDGVNVR